MESTAGIGLARYPINRKCSRISDTIYGTLIRRVGSIRTFVTMNREPLAFSTAFHVRYSSYSTSLMDRTSTKVWDMRTSCEKHAGGRTKEQARKGEEVVVVVIVVVAPFQCLELSSSHLVSSNSYRSYRRSRNGEVRRGHGRRMRCVALVNCKRIYSQLPTATVPRKAPQHSTSRDKICDSHTVT